jgi:hypothetical protein
MPSEVAISFGRKSISRSQASSTSQVKMKWVEVNMQPSTRVIASHCRKAQKTEFRESTQT